MKTKFLLLIAFLFVVIELMAQAPLAFKYQAVVRDGSGAILTGRAITVRATIRRSTSGGTIVYRETFAVTTNAYGIANLEIGTGTIVSGTFPTIDWGSYSHYLQIEVDINGGTSFTSLGAAQLLSVPYALYAGKSNNSSISDADNNTHVTTEHATNENYIRFYTNGTERLRITPTGRIETASTSNSVYLGEGAGKNNSGSNNVFVGDSAGSKATGMSSSVALGYKTLYSNTTGDYNSAIGTQALQYNTTGASNTAGGYNTMYNNTTGSYNTAFGRSSSYSNITGASNTSLGYQSLYNNTSGSSNVAIGRNALYSNTSSSNSVAIGYYALYNQNGFTATDTLNNIAIGNYALYDNDPTSDITGRNNVALGHMALTNNSTGATNTALGNMALRYNTTGNYNTAAGTFALYANTTGSYNTGYGRRAGEVNNGNYNTFVGYDAGNSNTSGAYNTFVGTSSSGAATINNSMAIGYSAYVGVSNTVVIGNSSVSSIGGYAAWTNFSDIRLKENLKYRNDLGLDFVMKLKPASYNYITDQNKTRYDGLIAQDVEKALKELGVEFSGLVIDNDEQKTHNLAYGQFVIPLINAVQELNKQNLELIQRIEKLEKKSNRRNK